MKRVYEVHIPHPQVLVYFIEAESPEEALKIAKTPGTVEDHSIYGPDEERVFIRLDLNPES